MLKKKRCDDGIWIVSHSLAPDEYGAGSSELKATTALFKQGVNITSHELPRRYQYRQVGALTILHEWEGGFGFGPTFEAACCDLMGIYIPGVRLKWSIPGGWVASTETRRVVALSLRGALEHLQSELEREASDTDEQIFKALETHNFDEALTELKKRHQLNGRKLTWDRGRWYLDGYASSSLHEVFSVPARPSKLTFSINTDQTVIFVEGD